MLMFRFIWDFVLGLYVIRVVKALCNIRIFNPFVCFAQFLVNVNLFSAGTYSNLVHASPRSMHQ